MPCSRKPPPVLAQRPPLRLARCAHLPPAPRLELPLRRYVRHTSTHSVPYVNGSGPHTTIGRPPAPDVKPSRFGFGGRWPGSSGSGSGSGSSKPKK